MSETVTTSCAYTYTVKRGDSFYLIARRLGVPLRDLMNANADIHPSRLMVGDRLCIPSCAEQPAGEPDAPAQEPQTPDPCPTPTPEPEPTPDACPAERRKVVLAGQTVADIQLENNKSFHTLEAANPDVDLDDLSAGDVLCVPELNLPCALPGSVVLAEGETLASTAQRFDVSVAQLLRANPCLAPRDFVAGVTVKLPQ